MEELSVNPEQGVQEPISNSDNGSDTELDHDNYGSGDDDNYGAGGDNFSIGGGNSSEDDNFLSVDKKEKNIEKIACKHGDKKEKVDEEITRVHGDKKEQGSEEVFRRHETPKKMTGPASPGEKEIEDGAKKYIESTEVGNKDASRLFRFEDNSESGNKRPINNASLIEHEKRKQDEENPDARKKRKVDEPKMELLNSELFSIDAQEHGTREGRYSRKPKNQEYLNNRHEKERQLAIERELELKERRLRERELALQKMEFEKFHYREIGERDRKERNRKKRWKSEKRGSRDREYSRRHEHGDHHQKYYSHRKY